MVKEMKETPHIIHISNLFEINCEISKGDSAYAISVIYCMIANSNCSNYCNQQAIYCWDIFLL